MMPVLVLRFEANNADQLNEMITLVREAMSKYEPVVILGQELC